MKDVWIAIYYDGNQNRAALVALEDNGDSDEEKAALALSKKGVVLDSKNDIMALVSVPMDGSGCYLVPAVMIAGELVIDPQPTRQPPV